MGNKERIAVVGAGLMGHGIAQVFACSGHPVRVFDTNEAALDTVHARIRSNLFDLGQDEAAAHYVTADPNLDHCVRDADVIFEAGPENVDFKRKLFAHLEQVASADALLASNTSVIPITNIMHGLGSGHRAMGTHWWNPPYLVPLVEIVKTADTDPQLAQRMSALLTSAGKTPVIVDKDIAGFIGNRLQHALWREAIALVAAGVCDAETVDTVVKASFGRRLAVLGPLENADLVGVDLTLAIHENILPDLDCSTGASPYLEQLVEHGRLGMKSGNGFRQWSAEQQAQVRARVFRHLNTLNDAERHSREVSE